MSDITSPQGVVGVQWQEDKPASDGDAHKRELPANKVIETYEETARGVSDSITILGIPAELMTTQVQATIGGLVAEVQFLKSKVKRYEASLPSSQPRTQEALLVGEELILHLDKSLSKAQPEALVRELALIVVNTFEDIRRSSGVLAANAVLADVVLELQSSSLEVQSAGLVGGPIIAVLLAKPEVTGEVHESGQVSKTTADLVREIVEGRGYAVAGLDMKLSFTVASVRVETGQSALQVIGQADHIIRS